MGRSAVVVLLLGSLGVSTAYGVLLLLPLYVRELGGDEADFGFVFSAGTLPAILCVGALVRFPETLRPHTVLAISMAAYGTGTAGAALVTES